ncbi:MAG: HD-GYP domain-containing protein [bacterium]
MNLNDIKKIFLKRSLLIFSLLTLWPICFLIYNELIYGRYRYVTIGTLIAYIGPLICLPFIGYLLQDRYEKGEELSNATEKISELMLNVVQKKQLGIRYNNPYLSPCWEIKKCVKKECPAYKADNLRCWQIAGTYCAKGVSGEMAGKIKDCRLCKVYKTSIPNELADIGEDFNNMMVVLEYMSAQQYEDYINTTEALSKLIEMKDPYTGGQHCHTVQRYALGTAKYLNLLPSQMENIKIAAILHDIGKIGIKGAILNKNGPLDDMEYEQIKKHALIGGEAIKSIGKLKDIRMIIRYHHERYDGRMDGKFSSYTGEVRGEQIPVEARVITLVDAYDAMTSDRPYRKAMSKEEAMEIIKRENGAQFDPKCVEAFFKFLKEEKVI